ncbi:MAG: hypothetical protein F6K00_21300 [Leptolyngbya sp. SIOISBB]|nr:hypothetical protein [Leptolyngbya sp. SIOISBB]
MLKFETPQARQLADQLLQPALIRIIDNIRKQLETSDWQGTYQETQIWPEGTQESTLQRFKELQAQLSQATPEAADVIRLELTQLPQPFPGYELHLTKAEQACMVDVWHLCYCVCFQAYPVTDGPVHIDESIIDQELNDVDWLVLDNKAKAIVEDVFNQLGT